MALSIICDAVERYKELCEGAYAGMLCSPSNPYVVIVYDIFISFNGAAP